MQNKLANIIAQAALIGTLGGGEDWRTAHGMGISLHMHMELLVPV